MKKVENLKDSSKLDPLIFSAFFSLLRKPAEQAPQTAALLRDGAARALTQLDRTSCLNGEAGSAKRIEKDPTAREKLAFPFDVRSLFRIACRNINVCQNAGFRVGFREGLWPPKPPP